MSSNVSAGEVSRTPAWVLGVCMAAILFEGYDLLVYGAVLPYLLEFREWALTPEQAGFIGSLPVIGMFFGALFVGAITDILGRRKIVLFFVSWFSLFMGLCAAAPSLELFGLFRFLAGIGLGGVLPTVVALMVEYSPERRRNLNNAVVFAGVGLGGILAALLTPLLVPAFGFRVMFLIGMVPLVTVVPLAYRYLPESISFLLANGRREEATRVAGRLGMSLGPTASRGAAQAGQEEVSTEASTEVSTRGGKLNALASLFSGRYVVATLLFWVATFLCLLVLYGLNNWLPTIMREAGFALGSTASFLLVLNLGSVVGTLFSAVAADRLGSKPVVLASFLAAAVSILLLSFQPPLLALYALIVVAGVGSAGTQVLVNVYVASYYAAGNRATALGMSLGVGRLGAILGPIVGGLVLGSGLGLAWNFYAFAIPSLLGALAILMVPRLGPRAVAGAPVPQETAQTT